MTRWTETIYIFFLAPCSYNFLLFLEARAYTVIRVTEKTERFQLLLDEDETVRNAERGEDFDLICPTNHKSNNPQDRPVCKFIAPSGKKYDIVDRYLVFITSFFFDDVMKKSVKSRGLIISGLVRSTNTKMTVLRPLEMLIMVSAGSKSATLAMKNRVHGNVRLYVSKDQEVQSLVQR